MKTLFILIITFLFANEAMSQGQPHSSALNGRWIFVSTSELDMGKIPDDQLPDLLMEDSLKKFSGSAGCNRISGTYEAGNEEFLFGPMMSTFKSCPDMQVENYIMKFLTQVGSYRVEDSRLILYDRSDKGRFITYRRFHNQLAMIKIRNQSNSMMPGKLSTDQ